jgi:hypothetical protein
MPECIFCGEWAGPDSDQHEECGEEFRRNLSLARPFERLVLRLFAKIRAVRRAVVRHLPADRC